MNELTLEAYRKQVEEERNKKRLDEWAVKMTRLSLQELANTGKLPAFLRRQAY